MTPTPAEALARPDVGSRDASRRGIGRIAVYYVFLAVAGILLVRFSPLVREAVAGGALTDPGPIFGADAPPPVGTPVGGSAWSQALVAIVSMLGALAIMVPVTWVYMVTRGHRRYDESVVHSLLILPVAVTGIVMVVKSSVALAFSLAGIVAAVRFRTSLDDTKDAVYIFLAIGVGLASGIQALGIAIALSIVFNLVILVLWTTRFGDVHATSGAGALGLGSALAAPAGFAAAHGLGDAGMSERIERHILEERSKKKEKRANALIVVHARAAEPAQGIVDPLLEERAKRWKLAEIGPGPSGVLLVYLARLDDGAQGAVMDRLRNGADGAVVGAEVRSLKGVRPRE